MNLQEMCLKLCAATKLLHAFYLHRAISRAKRVCIKFSDCFDLFMIPCLSGKCKLTKPCFLTLLMPCSCRSAHHCPQRCILALSCLLDTIHCYCSTPACVCMCACIHCVCEPHATPALLHALLSLRPGFVYPGLTLASS